LNDHHAIAQEQKAYKDLPSLSNVSQKEILDNYLRIKKTFKPSFKIERMMNTPELESLIRKK